MMELTVCVYVSLTMNNKTISWGSSMNIHNWSFRLNSPDSTKQGLYNPVFKVRYNEHSCCCIFLQLSLEKWCQNIEQYPLNSAHIKKVRFGDGVGRHFSCKLVGQLFCPVRTWRKAITKYRTFVRYMMFTVTAAKILPILERVASLTVSFIKQQYCT